MNNKRITIFAGHYGSGKTNISVNYALWLKEKTGKTIEVMIYGDGAFKDPVGKIWELADPVVSPAFTPGLVGTPNEIKIKYISDNKLSHLKGEELAEAMREEIRNKAKNCYPFLV